MFVWGVGISSILLGFWLGVLAERINKKDDDEAVLLLRMYIKELGKVAKEIECIKNTENT